LGVGLIEEAQFLLDGQPVDDAALFGRSMQAGALPGDFEHFLALDVVDPLADEDGGDGNRGTGDGDHNPVCFIVFGVQTRSARHRIWARVEGIWDAERALVESSLADDQPRRFAMRVKVLLQITAEDGNAAGAQVAVFDKQTERPEDLGLSIAEGKALMAAVQQRVVDAQLASWAERHRCCEACGARRQSKGSYPVVFLTLYGDVRVASPRLRRCPCHDGPATVSPLRNLIPDYVAPERLYLEARWASLVPYAAAAGLLADILPIAAGANATTLREHVLRVAERAEAELGEERPCFIDGCPADWARLPIPEGRIAVALVAARSATGKTGRPTSRSSSAGRCQKIVPPVTSVWCMATTASRSADYSTRSRARVCRQTRTSPS
jgi:hypothetical protein